MTTEEKLKHFNELCSKDAQDRSNQMLVDYEASLNEIFEHHKTDAQRQAKMQLEAESEKQEREINKQLSLHQLQMKRMLSEKQEELKGKLFSELRDKLALFMETAEYNHFLDRKIGEALAFAGDEEITLYLDPSDEDKLHLLELNHEKSFKISQYSFNGGIRAVIPSKNILIDHSFSTMLEESQANFQFNPGGIAGE